MRCRAMVLCSYFSVRHLVDLDSLTNSDRIVRRIHTHKYVLYGSKKISVLQNLCIIFMCLSLIVVK